jgi:hypothetical protein
MQYLATLARPVFVNRNQLAVFFSGIAISGAAPVGQAAQAFGRDSNHGESTIIAKPFSVRSNQADSEPIGADALVTARESGSKAVQRHGRDSVYGESIEPTPEAPTAAATPPPAATEPIVMRTPSTPRVAPHRQRSASPSQPATPPTPVTPEEPLAVDLRSVRWTRELDHVRNAVEATRQSESKVVASATVVSSTASVGYVLWLLRGGLLVASLMSSLPAWSSFDPLPILASGERKRKRDAANSDSLEHMFERNVSTPGPQVAAIASDGKVTALSTMALPGRITPMRLETDIGNKTQPGDAVLDRENSNV